nr:reverse transcriptase domain-containing protein [Tanacetum cinerariifolium]
NELNELHDQAYENSLIYKEWTKKLHGDKIKNRIFNVGDQVLLFNSKLKIFSGKLKSRWSSPFTISKIYPYGTAKLIHPDGCNFKVNCYRLKHYHGGDPPPLEILDDYLPKIEDFLCRILSWFPRPSYPLIDFSLGKSISVKENHKKDKIESKPDKNGKRVEAGKSLKQLQWVEEEKLNKTQKEWPETQTQSKAIQVFKERRKEKGQKCKF